MTNTTKTAGPLSYKRYSLGRGKMLVIEGILLDGKKFIRLQIKDKGNHDHQSLQAT